MNTVNDFFCGAGGMGLGFKHAGFEIAGAWDFDKYAVESYRHNVGDHVKQADISEMTYKDVPKAGVWTFGFPCQDLSNAGKQAGMKLKCVDCGEEMTAEVGSDVENCSSCGSDKLKAASRSGLFFEIMRLLDETKMENPEALPKIIMAENVKGLRKLLPILKKEYNKRGYRMTFTIYNSKYWGVPQNRERYFVVGIREDLKRAFQFPWQQTEYIPKLSGVLETEVDEKYYIPFEKTQLILKQAAQKIEVPEATKKGYAEAVEGDSINISYPNSKTRRGRVGKQVAQTLLTGQEQIVVEPTQEEKRGVLLSKQATHLNKFMDQTGTLIARDYKGFGNQEMTGVMEKSEEYYRIRKLTPREYARLQGFPDDYEQIVSNSQFYKQMGNAVTVNVAEAIAKQIQLYLNGEPFPEREKNANFPVAVN